MGIERPCQTERQCSHQERNALEVNFHLKSYVVITNWGEYLYSKFHLVVSQCPFHLVKEVVVQHVSADNKPLANLLIVQPDKILMRRKFPSCVVLNQLGGPS